MYIYFYMTRSGITGSESHDKFARLGELSGEKCLWLWKFLRTFGLHFFKLLLLIYNFHVPNFKTVAITIYQEKRILLVPSAVVSFSTLNMSPPVICLYPCSTAYSGDTAGVCKTVPLLLLFFQNHLSSAFTSGCVEPHAFIFKICSYSSAVLACTCMCTYRTVVPTAFLAQAKRS